MKNFSTKSVEIKENDVAQFRKQMFNAKFSRMNALRAQSAFSSDVFVSPRQGKHLVVKGSSKEKNSILKTAPDFLEKVLVQTKTQEDITKIEEVKENIDRMIREKKISEEYENKPMYYAKENEIPTAEYFLKLYTKSIKSNVQKIKEEKNKFKQIMDFINLLEREKYKKNNIKVKDPSRTKRQSPEPLSVRRSVLTKDEEGAIQENSVENFFKIPTQNKVTTTTAMEDKGVNTVYTLESEGRQNTKPSQSLQKSVDNIIINNCFKPSKRPYSALEVKGNSFSSNAKHIHFAHPSPSVNFQFFLKSHAQTESDNPKSSRASPEFLNKRTDKIELSKESLYTMQEARRYLQNMVESKWKEVNFQDELIKKRREIKITKIFKSPFTWDNHIENTVVKNNQRVMINSPVALKKTGEFVRVPQGNTIRIFKPQSEDELSIDVKDKYEEKIKIKNDTSFRIAVLNDEDAEDNNEVVRDEFMNKSGMKFPRKERVIKNNSVKDEGSELSEGELRDMVNNSNIEIPRPKTAQLMRQNSLPRKEERKMTRLEHKSIDMKNLWRKEILTHGKLLRKSTMEIEKNIKKIGVILQETSAEKERIKKVDIGVLEKKIDKLNKRMNYKRKKRLTLRSQFMKSYNTIEQAEKNILLHENQKKFFEKKVNQIDNLSHFVKSFV